MTSTSTASTPPRDDGVFIANRAEVDAGFFEAAGIDILRGRSFSDADRPARGRHQRGGGPALLGRRRRRGAAGTAAQRRSPVVVVGVVSDAKVRTLGEGPRDMICLPYSQTVHARAHRPGADIATDAERTALTLLTAARPGFRPVGSQDEDDGPPPRADAFTSAALRLRPVRVRSAGAGTRRGRSLRRGQLRRRPADARDRHPDGTGAPTPGASSAQLVAGGLKLVVVGGVLGLAICRRRGAPAGRGCCSKSACWTRRRSSPSRSSFGGAALLAAYQPASRSGASTRSLRSGPTGGDGWIHRMACRRGARELRAGTSPLADL